MPVRAAARMAAFIPGASPPLVKIAIFLVAMLCARRIAWRAMADQPAKKAPPPNYITPAGLQAAGGRADLPAHARSGPRSWPRCPTPPPRATARRTPSTSTASASCARSTGGCASCPSGWTTCGSSIRGRSRTRDRVFFGATVTVEDDEGEEADLPHRRRRRDRRRRRRHLLAIAGRARAARASQSATPSRCAGTPALRELTVAGDRLPLKREPALVPGKRGVRGTRTG